MQSVVYVLTYFSKGSGEESIAACDDHDAVVKWVRGMNAKIGYKAGIGMYSQEADGCYGYRKLKVIRGDDLEQYEGNLRSDNDADLQSR